jgi:hypothetical protein
MLDYPRLGELVTRIPAGDPHNMFGGQVVPCLIDAWLDDYARSNDASQIVETTTSGFSYLFDIGAGRLLAAWGISGGRHGAARDKSRMAGHPLSAGTSYHRGHAIAHTLGGPTDIGAKGYLPFTWIFSPSWRARWCHLSEAV